MHAGIGYRKTALGFTILAIVIASFALGISFADIRAEVRARVDMCQEESQTAEANDVEVLKLCPANTIMSKRCQAA